MLVIRYLTCSWGTRSNLGEKNFDSDPVLRVQSLERNFFLLAAVRRVQRLSYDSDLSRFLEPARMEVSRTTQTYNSGETQKMWDLFNLKIYELNLNLKMILNSNVLHHLSADVVVSNTSFTYMARIRIFEPAGSTTSYTTLYQILQDDAGFWFNVLRNIDHLPQKEDSNCILRRGTILKG